MAKEGRSYDRSHFDKAVSIFRRFGLKNEDEIQKIENLIEQVESRLKAMNEEEEELGDIPDEFLGFFFFFIHCFSIILFIISFPHFSF